MKKTPLKSNKKPLSDDTIFVLSKNYNLKDFEKYRKDNKVSFNDIMLCSFSVAMKNVLKKYKPKLAISIYHSLDDFVDIPLFLNSLNLGYKFYIKHGTIHHEETVLLAISR